VVRQGRGGLVASWSKHSTRTGKRRDGVCLVSERADGVTDRDGIMAFALQLRRVLTARRALHATASLVLLATGDLHSTAAPCSELHAALSSRHVTVIEQTTKAAEAVPRNVCVAESS
jgi:hypothetical protein